MLEMDTEERCPYSSVHWPFRKAVTCSTCTLTVQHKIQSNLVHNEIPSMVHAVTSTTNESDFPELSLFHGKLYAAVSLSLSLSLSCSVRLQL